MTRHDCCATFWSPLRRQFGGHTLDDAGGSHWMPLWFHFTFRLLATGTNIAILIYTSVTKRWTLVLATAIWLPNLLLLITASALNATRRSRPRCLADVALPLHQTLVSLTLFFLPLFVYLTARDSTLWPETAFMGGVLLLFLIDLFLMGSCIRFRIQIIWLPVLVDIAFFAFPAVALTTIAAKVGVKTALGFATVVGASVAGAFYALLWSLLSAVIVVVVTRFTDCCFPPQPECGPRSTLDLA